MPIVMTVAALVQWIQLGQQVVAAGSGLWMQISAILKTHNIEADTSALDEVIADADRRRALAAAEKTATR